MILRVQKMLWLAALALFLVWSFPANHSEAEDAYSYAWTVEQGWGVPGMFHGHHLLYLPLMRLLWLGAQFLGYSGRAFPLMAAMSTLCGAVAVYLLFSLFRFMGLKARSVWPFAAALLFSYGFWRYSTTVEIYIPVVALCLLAFWCAVRSAEQPRFVWGAMLAGGLAPLIHLAAVPAVWPALPLLFWLRGERRNAAVCAVAIPLLVAAGYGLVFACGIRPDVFSDAMVQRSALLAPETFAKALTAWGQTLLSGNFLFSFPSVAERMQYLLPFQMLQEEVWMGTHAPGLVRWAGLSFVMALLIAGACVISVAPFIGRAWRHREPVFVAALLWLAGSLGLAFCFEPSNPEMWICALPPFWLLAAWVWREVPEGRWRSRWPACLAAIMLLHNWLGGMLPVRSPHGDYCRQKGRWVLQQVRSGDLIVTAESHSFVTFLRHFSSAEVLDAKFVGAAESFERGFIPGRRVFVLDDVLEPLPPVARRGPAAVEALRRFGEELRPDLCPLHSGALGTVYEWQAPSGYREPTPALVNDLGL
jgi:hypothetical protein